MRRCFCVHWAQRQEHKLHVVTLAGEVAYSLVDSTFVLMQAAAEEVLEQAAGIVTKRQTCSPAAEGGQR